MVTFNTCAFFLFNLFALYPRKDSPRTESFLSDVVSSFRFFFGHSDFHVCDAVYVLLSIPSFSCWLLPLWYRKHKFTLGLGVWGEKEKLV